MATLDEFRKYLDAMAPGEREAFISDLLADYGGMENRIGGQEDYATEMRNTGTPGMRDTGRFTVAANPLEFLGAGLRRYQGDRDTRRVEEERRENSARRENALRALFSMRAGGGGGGAPAGGMAAPSAPSMPGGPVAVAQALRRMGSGR